MKFALQAIVIAWFWAGSAMAQSFPPYSSTTVNDFADLLSETSAAALRDRLAQLLTDTGIEMTVVTLPNQAAYAPGLSLETFATALFNDWGVGDAARNDGIMVLVLPQDRAMRVELGAGFDRQWDSVAQGVVDNSFLPHFRAGDYQTGIMVGTQVVIDRIALPFREGQPPPKANDFPILSIILIGICALAVRQLHRIGALFTRLRTCPKCGTRGSLRVYRRTITYPTTMTRGRDERTVTCTKCDHKDTRIIHTSRRSNRTSGSGGGFGGGRSGGGGASGRW